MTPPAISRAGGRWAASAPARPPLPRAGGFPLPVVPRASAVRVATRTVVESVPVALGGAASARRGSRGGGRFWARPGRGAVRGSPQRAGRGSRRSARSKRGVVPAREEDPLPPRGAQAGRGHGLVRRGRFGYVSRLLRPGAVSGGRDRVDHHIARRGIELRGLASAAASWNLPTRLPLPCSYSCSASKYASTTSWGLRPR